jgi:hypothetical protein
MSLERVRAWRDALRRDVANAPAAPLSREGLALVLGHALDAVHDDALAAAWARPGAPVATATVVAARTTLTAPVEWCALLLADGAQVTLKHPSDAPGLAPWLASHAVHAGLPLRATGRRDVGLDAERVVVMGGDATVRAVSAVVPAGRLLAFGHRASAAVWDPRAAPEAADALAADLGAHDTRGCMSPAVILLPPGSADIARAALAPALARAEARWPRGDVADDEHAALRAQRALARVLGHVEVGATWEIHTLPAAQATLAPLPRRAQLVETDDPIGWLQPLAGVLSTVGHDPSAPAAVLHGLSAALPDVRLASLGAMQAPPLARRHDGVDHLTRLRRSTG